MHRNAAVIAALLVVATACATEPEEPASAAGGVPAAVPGPVQIDSTGARIPPAPTVPTGPLDPAAAADLEMVVADYRFVLASPARALDLEALGRLGASNDPRIGWYLADLLRFVQHGDGAEATTAAFERLTGTTVTGFPWSTVTDWLIAWDLPAAPGYREWKGRLFEAVEPAWAPFFADPDADVDWRHLSWGGVFIDDRPIDVLPERCPRGCIPALDDPAVTDAVGGGWYPDSRYVFGVVVGGEARAYPRHIMEVHEMVNDTLGGRRIGIPYCTLCGSAQAYFTDVVPPGIASPLELRTTGLLIRSNKVMYDLTTWSLLDTFLGTAVSGPLHDAGFTLEPLTVVTSTWGDWKAAHPDTTIVASDGGIGAQYSFEPLGGRDDSGPIFPVGDVDVRLPVQEQVLGVIAPDGTPVAFPAAAARSAIDRGASVELAGVVVRTDGAGLVAEARDGRPLTSHQAFWFAWSQFHEGSLVWIPPPPQS